MAEAPIEPRPYAVAAWTGSRVVFWAGSSLSRGFAYTDGALYDPTTDSWEAMAVPGWGHPGLTSVFFDGELYALAKGGGTRFDPVAGEWRDLPPVEGMFLAAAVATDDGIWGLGPADLDPAGQPDLAIARYLADDDMWVYGRRGPCGSCSDRSWSGHYHSDQIRRLTCRNRGAHRTGMAATGDRDPDRAVRHRHRNGWG